MTESKKALFDANGILDKVYGQEVNRLIRARYSLPDELAILRQRDEKPEEFAEYCAFAEECKRRAKEDIYGGASAWV